MLPQGTAGSALTATSTVAAFRSMGQEKPVPRLKEAKFAIRCETDGGETGRIVANTDNLRVLRGSYGKVFSSSNRARSFEKRS